MLKLLAIVNNLLRLIYASVFARPRKLFDKHHLLLYYAARVDKLVTIC